MIEQSNAMTLSRSDRRGKLKFLRKELVKLKSKPPTGKQLIDIAKYAKLMEVLTLKIKEIESVNEYHKRKNKQAIK